MFDFASICDFSRTHCIAMCAFLVPANLLVTTLTLSIVVFQLPQPKLKHSISLAAILALVMISHVLTWFMVGVVAAPTYILLGLASTCLIINFGALYYAKTRTNSAIFIPNLVTEKLTSRL
jgi:predicted neutral ceramidase superfamily lipid hydrolase